MLRNYPISGLRLMIYVTKVVTENLLDRTIVNNFLQYFVNDIFSRIFDRLFVCSLFCKTCRNMLYFSRKSMFFFSNKVLSQNSVYRKKSAKFTELYSSLFSWESAIDRFLWSFSKKNSLTMMYFRSKSIVFVDKIAFKVTKPDIEVHNILQEFANVILFVICDRALFSSICAKNTNNCCKTLLGENPFF